MRIHQDFVPIVSYSDVTMSAETVLPDNKLEKWQGKSNSMEHS